MISCILSYRDAGFATDPPVPGQSPAVNPYGGGLPDHVHMIRMSPGYHMMPQYTLNFATNAAAFAAAAMHGIWDC